METESETIEMLELIRKNFKRAVTNMFKNLKENMSI